MNRSLLLVAILAAMILVTCGDGPQTAQSSTHKLTPWKTMSASEDATIRLRYDADFTFLATKDNQTGAIEVTVTERCAGRESIMRTWRMARSDPGRAVRRADSVADTKVDCTGRPDRVTFEQFAHALSPHPFHEETSR